MSEIKDGAYVAVGGKVARVFQYQGKTGVEVHVQDDRMKYPDRYTAFDVTEQVTEGDRVEVRGWLSTQVEEFQKRDGSTGHGVKRSINAPKVTKREPAQDAPAGGEWATAEVPF